MGAQGTPRGGLSVIGQPDLPAERADARRNRQRILGAARKLMKKRPLGDLCMDQVAEAAGVGKGTLYRRFADRTALLFAVLDEDERVLQQTVLDGLGLSRGASAQERLLALLEAIAVFHLDHVAVLAAAEASTRPFARFDNPPYAWRHAAIADGLQRAGLSDAAGAHYLSDVMLQAISGEVLLRALQEQDVQQVLSQVRAFFSSLVLRRHRTES